MRLWGTVMRLVSFGCTVAACTLLAVPAVAFDHQTPSGHDSAYAPNDRGGSNVTPVARGQELAIECESIGTPDAHVNVVMAFDPVQGEAPTGYEAVLLTDQSIGGKAVHVRVPDMPDLVHHTVTVRVYVTNAQGTTSCNAGHLRIG